MDDDEFVDMEHIVAASKQRFGVSQKWMDISENGMMEAHDVMRKMQRNDGGGEDREEHRNRNEEARALIEGEREGQSFDLKKAKVRKVWSNMRACFENRATTLPS